MKKLVLTIIFLTCATGISAQYNKLNNNKLTDSLSRILANTESDTVYLKALNSLSQFYIKNNPDTAIKLIEEGITLAENKNNRQFLAHFYNNKGIYFRYNKKLDSALTYYQLASSNYLAIQDSARYIGSLVNKGNVLRALGDYKQAVNYLSRGIEYFESKTEPKFQTSALITKFNLAGVYLFLKEYDKGIKLSKEIIENPLTIKNKRLYAKTCINLVAFLTKTGEVDEGLEYGKKAESIITDKLSLANLSTNMGTLFDKKKEYKEAINYFNKALGNYQNLENSEGIIKSYNNLGSTYTSLNQFTKAEEYLLKAKAVISKSDNYNISSARYNYQYLSILYEKNRRPEKALFYYKKVTQINDSIFNQEMREAVLEMETKYETEKNLREKEKAEANEMIANQRAENSQKRFIGAVVFSGIVALLLFVIFNRLKLIRKQKRELDKAYELLEESKRYELAASNLKALKSQMNPHFIFNSLNSIQDLILQQDTDKSYDYIVLFAELVRNTLTYSNNEFIAFHKEIDFLSVYLELEQLRFGDEFTYEIETNGITDIKVPSLIIQPFLENSLKHGLLHKEGEKRLSLEFKLGKELICVIEDNGIGRKESERIQERRGNKTHQSFAMGAIKKRLELLSDRFNEEFSFEVEDLYEYDIAKGTRITVTIPFQDEF